MESNHIFDSNSRSTISATEKVEKLKAACWPGYISRWSARRWESFLASFDSNKPVNESTITALFNALDVESSQQIVDAITQKLPTGDVSYPMNFSDLKDGRVLGNRRSIDSVLVSPPGYLYARPIFIE